MALWIRKMLQKYRELLLYALVGVVTTLINVVAFSVCHTTLGLHYALANVIAWMLSVLYAFFANKIFVFENHGWSAAVVWHEAVTFFLSRAASLLVDEAGMWLLISVLQLNELISKLLVNGLVILINYVLGKLWVFGKKAADEKPAAAAPAAKPAPADTLGTEAGAAQANGFEAANTAAQKEGAAAVSADCAAAKQGGAVQSETAENGAEGALATAAPATAAPVSGAAEIAAAEAAMPENEA